MTTTDDPMGSATFRRLGHRLIDTLADAIDAQARGDGPVMPPLTPREACAVFETPAVDVAAAVDLDAAFDDVVRRALQTATQLHAPGFVGHQVATPLPTAALFDLVSATLNNGMAIFEMGKGGTALERAALRWLVQALSLSWSTSMGVLCQGGSIGNLTALLAARQHHSDDAWRRGLRVQPQLAVFVADTAHYSVARACRIMGLGDEGCVSVPVDDRLRMSVPALKAAIALARGKKKRPMAVVASLGSTAAGAIDPLAELADVCAAEGLWLHVDGAHGGPLALLPERRGQLVGLERADSLVCDFHKLLQMPALCTAVLFRDGKTGAAAFAQKAGYLFPEDDGVSDVDVDDSWSDVGRRTIECTKAMLGLKVWGSLRLYGRAHFEAHVRRCCELGTTLAALVKAEPSLELLCEPEMNIVCFRLKGRSGGDNAAARRRVLDSGRLYPVQVHLTVDGIDAARQGLWLRCALQNPHTTHETLRELVAAVVSSSSSSSSSSSASNAAISAADPTATTGPRPA
jgi:L-2,4-diaminobutyrate decarboxylase